MSEASTYEYAVLLSCAPMGADGQRELHEGRYIARTLAHIQGQSLSRWAGCGYAVMRRELHKDQTVGEWEHESAGASIAETFRSYPGRGWWGVK